jgi:acetyltransferase-like isoleucine patch superfamily enzyme
LNGVKLSDFYSNKELASINFRSIGSNCLISKDIKIVSPERLIIGNNVRIDPYCILTFGDVGEIVIGSYIHIADKVRLVGSGGIIIEDYCNIGISSTILSASDDYSGNALMGPMSPPNTTNVELAKVTLKRYSVVATNSVVLPGVTLNEGSVLGAMSLAHRDLKEWCMYFGIPAQFLKKRKKELINLVNQNDF